MIDLKTVWEKIALIWNLKSTQQLQKTGLNWVRRKLVSYIKNPLLGRFFNELWGWEKNNFGLVDFWCKIRQQLPFFLPNISLLLFFTRLLPQHFNLNRMGFIYYPPKRNFPLFPHVRRKGLFLPFPRKRLTAKTLMLRKKVKMRKVQPPKHCCNNNFESVWGWYHQQNGKRCCCFFLGGG